MKTFFRFLIFFFFNCNTTLPDPFFTIFLFPDFIIIIIINISQVIFGQDEEGLASVPFPPPKEQNSFMRIIPDHCRSPPPGVSTYRLYFLTYLYRKPLGLQENSLQYTRPHHWPRIPTLHYLPEGRKIRGGGEEIYEMRCL